MARDPFGEDVYRGKGAPKRVLKKRKKRKKNTSFAKAFERAYG